MQKGGGDSISAFDDRNAAQHAEDRYKRDIEKARKASQQRRDQSWWHKKFGSAQYRKNIAAAKDAAAKLGEHRAQRVGRVDERDALGTAEDLDAEVNGPGVLRRGVDDKVWVDLDVDKWMRGTVVSVDDYGNVTHVKLDDDTGTIMSVGTRHAVIGYPSKDAERFDKKERELRAAKELDVELKKYLASKRRAHLASKLARGDVVTSTQEIASIM